MFSNLIFSIKGINFFRNICQEQVESFVSEMMILKVNESFKFPVKQTLANSEAWQVTAGGHSDHFTSD